MSSCPAKDQLVINMRKMRKSVCVFVEWILTKLCKHDPCVPAKVFLYIQKKNMKIFGD